MTERKIVGSFTEGFEYTVNGKELSHPIWAPKKPDPRFHVLDDEACREAHPQVPQQRYQSILRSTQWHD